MMQMHDNDLTFVSVWEKTEYKWGSELRTFPGIRWGGVILGSAVLFLF